jgi:regulator of sigma E protease
VTILVAILGLAVLVLVHEAGHFFVARAVGMRPRKFYVGFPPALVKTTRRGIEYGIGSIPLGGYVKIPGMHRPAPQDLEVHLAQALQEAPSLAAPVDRLRTTLAAGDLDAAKRGLPALAEAVRDARLLSPQARARAERALTDVEDALAPDAYWRAPTWKRIAVILAGPGTNFVLAIVLFLVVLAVGTGVYQLGFALKSTSDGKVAPVVDTVLHDHPAAEAGLRPGDRILAVGGHVVRQADDIPRLIRGSRGAPLSLTVRRGGERVVLPAVRARVDDGEPVGAAAWDALKITGNVTKGIGGAIVHIVHQHRDVSSAVGTVQVSSQAAKQGWRDYLTVQALISLSLALLNMLPLLPLDGGHIAFSIVEGVRRRAVAREVYERVSVVGIALVVLLFVVGLTNDVGRIGGG